MPTVPKMKPVKGAERHETDALAALNHLLAEDFRTITWEQQKAANVEKPSYCLLYGAVRRWAAALMGVWRSYSGRCAQIHEACGAEDPSMEAMTTLLNALSAHIGLPSGSFLSGENWPESNGVRRFVLRVADAPVELIEGELITKALLPKLESPSIQVLAARCFGPPELAPELQPQEDTELLSVDESNEVFLRLEESFRDAVIDDVDVPYREAVLAVFQAKAKDGVAVPQADNSSGGGLYRRGVFPKSSCSRESIQSLLNSRGWSTNDLAVKAGVDFHTASRYLNGSAKSYPSTRKKLADALGFRVEELPD